MIWAHIFQGVVYLKGEFAIFPIGLSNYLVMTLLGLKNGDVIDRIIAEISILIEFGK